MAAVNKTMQRFRRVFSGKHPAVIAMVHVKALPGTPGHQNESMKGIIQQACEEAKIYKENCVDGILIENMHDIPYVNKSVGPEIVAGMAAVCSAVKSEVGSIPCGTQILAGCNAQAIGVAKACDLDFIRAEGFVFSHVADEGIMNADAGDLLRYRKLVNAENVLVFTDIKKKHSSHAITKDLSVAEVAQAAEFFLSDGAILTGSHTGDPANSQDITVLKNNKVGIPILIGSGVDAENLSNFMSADGLIIGSHFKIDGHWKNTVDPRRVFSFMNKLSALKRSSI